jgi:predicted DNA-binding transcriptional regulator YafY
MKRGSLRRIYELDRMIRLGRLSSAAGAAEELEVTRRTVERDLELLRWELGAEVVYDRAKGRYCYSGDPFTLPAQWLNEREIAIILIAERALRMFTGASFARETHPAFNRLLDPIRHDRAAMAYIQDLCNGVHFHLPFSPVKDVSAEFSKVLAAILERRRLSLLYLSAKRGAAERRQIDPYVLINNGGEWYVVGKCLRHREVRTFTLANISDPKLEEQHFDVPREFDARKYLDQGFGRMHGNEAQDIRLSINPPAAAWVGRSVWHSSQSMEKRKDGSISLSMRCPVTDTLVRWVLQMGECVTVVKPEFLRRSVVEKAKAMAANNGRARERAEACGA